MPTIGDNQTRNELTAGESGAQNVQAAQSQSLQRAVGNQAQQQQAFHEFDVLQEQQRSSKAQEGLQQQHLQEQSRSNRMQEATQSDEQDIQLADKGLQRQGPSRADLLRQEMERGRQQQQMDKPLEVASPQRSTIAQSSVSQTPERAANDQARIQAEALSAKARFQDSMRRLNLAQATDDKAVREEASHNANQYIKSAAGLLDRIKNPGKASDSDWEDVKRLATQMGDQHPDPALQAEIDSKTAGPRVSQFLRAAVDHRALQYIAGTGDMPDGHLVDLSSPMMTALTQAAEGTSSFLQMADAQSGGAFSAGLKVKSLADRNRIIRKMAAQHLMTLQAMGQGVGSQAGAGDAGAMPIPSQGGPSARPQPSGDAIPNPGGGPPLLRSAADIQRSAERGRAAGAPAAAGTSGRDEIERRKEYGMGGQR